jgi:hypothetical protein
MPARLNLPLVLERAAIGCSAVAPAERRLRGFSNGAQLYGATLSGETVGPIHDYYKHLLGHESDAATEWPTWLEYRNVPRPMADTIAYKLQSIICEM